MKLPRTRSPHARPLRTARARLGASVLALATLAGSLVASAVLTTVAAPPAAAASAANFNPGMIISDAEFYNGNSMTQAQVQNFLASQYQGCSSGYTCIRDLRVDTFTRPADSLCAQYTGVAGEPASQIIWKVAQVCGVNPKALIVLLQKESSVITSTTPNYRSATGYGCPDTAACDSRYYGFYNQVYMAAWQFERYRANPTNYGYVAGRSNYILYNPNRACGGSNVYIQNQATAGLYIYTPYQPDAAALNNLYGLGDACSAYGNRNFWRMYTDWFGVTSAPVQMLVKTATDGTVYLVSGKNKYAVDNWDTVMALPTTWRSIATVSQATLDGFTTGTTLHRLVRAADGTVWFFDAGIKLRMPSCDMVADYGYSCTQPIPLLLDGDLAAYATGPTMTSVYTTTAGRRYYITDGTRREVLDDQSLQQANIPTATVVLTPPPIAALPLATPLVRDDVIIVNRADTSAALVRQGVTYRWSSSNYQQSTLMKVLAPGAYLDGPSVALLPKQVELTGFAKDSASGATYVMTSLGRSAIDPTAWGVTPSTWPTDLVNDISAAPPLAAPVFVKATTKPDVLMVANGSARAGMSGAALTALAGDPSPYIATLTDAEAAGLAAGPAMLTPGTLAKGNAADIFFIDGAGKKVHLSSMAIAQQLGLSSWTTDDAAVATYSLATGDLSPAIACGSTRYLGAAGAVRPVTAAQATAWGLPFVPMSTATCALLAARASGAALAGPVFVRTVDNATVYQLGDGTKRAITSYSALVRVQGSSSVPMLYFPHGALDAIPTGPSIS